VKKEWLSTVAGQIILFVILIWNIFAEDYASFKQEPFQL